MPWILFILAVSLSSFPWRDRDGFPCTISQWLKIREGQTAPSGVRSAYPGIWEYSLCAPKKVAKCIFYPCCTCGLKVSLREWERDQPLPPDSLFYVVLPHSPQVSKFFMFSVQSKTPNRRWFWKSHSQHNSALFSLSYQYLHRIRLMFPVREPLPIPYSIICERL